MSAHDTLIVSMKLKSGQFESELQLPFYTDKADELGASIGVWLKGVAAMLPIAKPSKDI